MCVDKKGSLVSDVSSAHPVFHNDLSMSWGTRAVSIYPIRRLIVRSRGREIGSLNHDIVLQFPQRWGIINLNLASSRLRESRGVLFSAPPAPPSALSVTNTTWRHTHGGNGCPSIGTGQEAAISGWRSSADCAPVNLINGSRVNCNYSDWASVAKRVRFPRNWMSWLWLRNGNEAEGRGQGNISQDDLKWKHFPRYWPFVTGIHMSSVNSPRKGQWRRALMFSLIYAWTNGWVNNRDDRDLRRHRAHYGVTVMEDLETAQMAVV